jgi:hypothetical protein
LYIPTSGFSPCRAGVNDTLQFLHKIRTIETNAFAQVPESEMQGGPEQGPLHKKYFLKFMKRESSGEKPNWLSTRTEKRRAAPVNLTRTTTRWCEEKATARDPKTAFRV